MARSEVEVSSVHFLQGEEAEEEPGSSHLEEGFESLLDDSARAAATPARRCRPRKVTVPLLGLALMAVAAVLSAPQERQQQQRNTKGGSAAAVDASVELAGFDVAAAAVEGLLTSSRLATDLKKSKDDASKMWSALSEPERMVRRQILSEGKRKSVAAHLAHLHGKDLLPKNDLLDGNPCPDSEEPFEGLCYKKCADLTNQTHPIRTTAFACCAAEPCSFFNTKFSNPLFYCSGLDVGSRYLGLGRSSICPHAPGDCLMNEEFNLGVCYKKCALLTNDTYPYRFSPHACCRYEHHLACLDAANTLSSPDYLIGGGAGDDLLEADAGKPHKPVPALAEAQS